MIWIALLLITVAATFMKLGVLFVWVKVLGAAAAVFGLMAALLTLTLYALLRKWDRGPKQT